jgi:hypothetical protein
VVSGSLTFAVMAWRWSAVGAKIGLLNRFIVGMFALEV